MEPPTSQDDMDVDSNPGLARSLSMRSDATTQILAPATPNPTALQEIKESIEQVQAMPDSALKTTLLKTLLQSYKYQSGFESGSPGYVSLLNCCV